MKISDYNSFPTELPIIVEDNLFLYPFMISPLFLSDEENIRSANDALEHNSLVLVCTTKAGMEHGRDFASIYDAGVTRNRVKEAEAHLRVAQERLRKAELGIGLEVRSARIAWSNARETLVVTDKMVEQAEESANLSRQRFETGVILSSELIDVENRLTEARMRRALAITQLQIAWADLKRALGTPQ